MTDEHLVSIRSEADVLAARHQGRELAATLGFSSTEVTLIATAISELARNILIYAGKGEIILRHAEKDGRRGIVIEARDRGPGIQDIERALQDGYSTSGGLGLGLPGARRLLDELVVQSESGAGTVVIGKKWAS